MSLSSEEVAELEHLHSEVREAFTLFADAQSNSPVADSPTLRTPTSTQNLWYAGSDRVQAAGALPASYKAGTFEIIHKGSDPKVSRCAPEHEDGSKIQSRSRGTGTRLIGTTMKVNVRHRLWFSALIEADNGTCFTIFRQHNKHIKARALERGDRITCSVNRDGNLVDVKKTCRELSRNDSVLFPQHSSAPTVLCRVRTRSTPYG